MQRGLGDTLEQVASREKHVNLQLEPQLNNYRVLSQVSLRSLKLLQSGHSRPSPRPGSSRKR